jgi:hypothetical protein
MILRIVHNKINHIFISRLTNIWNNSTKSQIFHRMSENGNQTHIIKEYAKRNEQKSKLQ